MFVHVIHVNILMVVGIVEEWVRDYVAYNNASDNIHIQAHFASYTVIISHALEFSRSFISQ